MKRVTDIIRQDITIPESSKVTNLRSRFNIAVNKVEFDIIYAMRNIIIQNCSVSKVTFYGM
jgi:hypothetical protein